MINDACYLLGEKPSAIRELFAYGLKRKQEIGEEKVFDFSLGNPNVPCPDDVTNNLKQSLSTDPVELHSYSMAAGLPDVRAKIAESISQNHNFLAKPEHVFLTTGAAGGLAACMNALANPGEEIILLSPYFAEYNMWVLSAGCEIVEVPCNKKTFQLDISAIDAAITEKTAAIVLNSPNNPTGAIYSEESIKELAQILYKAEKKYNNEIYIICDEPYRKITYGNKVPFVPSIYNNTVVCDSASKFLSLPGERIGHIYISSTADYPQDIFFAIAGAARALGHVCAPVMFQRMYAECIDAKPDLSVYKKNRDLITKKMDELGFEYIEPQGAFYLWIKSPFEDARKFSDLAKQYELLIVPSNSFGYNGWLRLGYCVSTSTIINSFPAWDELAKAIDRDEVK